MIPLRIAVIPVLVLITCWLLPSPALAQDDDQVEELELVSWMEDLSAIVRTLRIADTPTLRGIGLDGTGPIWSEDGSEPPFEPWTIERIARVLGLQFGDTDHFAVVGLEGSGRLLITTAADREADVRAFLGRFRQTAMAQARVSLTPVRLTVDAYSAMRRQFPRSEATDTAIQQWLRGRQAAGDAQVGAPVTGDIRNGERVVFRDVATRQYAALNAYLKEGEGGFFHWFRTVDLGWALACSTLVVRNGERVMVEINGMNRSLPGAPDEPFASRTLKSGATLDVPRLVTGEINATLMARPGRSYLLSAGSVQGTGFATLFVLRADVTRVRPAEMPGERTVKGLFTRRYDIWELCAPWLNTREGEMWPEDEGPRFQGDVLETIDESEPLSAEDIAKTFNRLCPDWAIVGAPDGEFRVVGGGYVELVNSPKAHESMQRALAALQAARPRSLGTDLVVWRLTAQQVAAIPGLRPGVDAPVTPQRIEAAIPAEARAAARVLDTTVWHLEGQEQATTNRDIRAFVSRFAVQTDKDVTLHVPDTDPLITGHSFRVRAGKDGDSWELSMHGTVASLLSTRQVTVFPELGDRAEQVDQPRLRYTDISGNMRTGSDRWAVRMLGSAGDEGDDRTVVLLARTFVVDED